MTVPVSIRVATRDDAAAMAAVEVAAAQRFRDIGMAHIADAEPTATADVLVRIDAGRATSRPTRTAHASVSRSIGCWMRTGCISRSWTSRRRTRGSGSACG